MLGSLLALLLIPRMGRTLAFFNWLVAVVAAVFLLASSLLATIGPRVATEQLNARGADVIGLGIISSTKLLSITWAAFGTMALSAFYWFFELIVECVRRRRTGKYTKNSAMYEK